MVKYEVLKDVFVPVLESYILKGAFIYNYENETKLTIDGEMNGSFQQKNGKISFETYERVIWFEEISNNTETFKFLEQTSEEVFGGTVLPPKTLAERNALELTTEDAYKVKIYNTTHEKEEIWNGYVWIGDGDIMCYNIRSLKLGFSGWCNNGFVTVDGKEIPTLTAIRPYDFGFYTYARQLGIISYQNPNSHHCTVTTRGKCMGFALEPILIGEMIIAPENHLEGLIGTTSGDYGTIGVALENQFNVNEYFLMNVSTSAEVY